MSKKIVHWPKVILFGDSITQVGTGFYCDFLFMLTLFFSEALNPKSAAGELCWRTHFKGLLFTLCLIQTFNRFSFP